MEKVRLLNGWTNRKESLPPAEPVRLFLDWPQSSPTPALAAPPPALNTFPNPTALRLYLTADLFSRLAQRTGRRVQLTDRPELAQVTVSAEKPASRNSSWLKVTAPVQSGDYEGFSLDEIRFYFYSNAPYSTSLKLGPDMLAGARAAFSRLKDYVRRFQAAENDQALPNLDKNQDRLQEWRDNFYGLLCDDLAAPRAVASIWMLLQSDLPDPFKLALLTDFAGVLGLSRGLGLPENARPIRPRIEERPSQPRQEQSAGQRHPTSPEPRRKEPVVTGSEGRNRQQPGQGQNRNANPHQKNDRNARDFQSEEGGVRRISRSQDVRSYLKEPDRFDFTVSVVAHDNLAEVRATVDSLLKILPRSTRSLEVIVAEMNGSEKVFEYLAPLSQGYANFRVVYAQQNLGEAAGRNIAFRQSRGRYLLLLDAGLRVTGDFFDELWRELSVEDRQTPALFGTFPVKLVKEGAASTGYELTNPANAKGEVEAFEGSVLCFRRELVEEAGFMDEHFRFPYALGLDYSFSFKDKGFALKESPTLEKMVGKPAGFARPVYGLSPDQQEKQRQRNWQLFLRSWGLEGQSR